MEYITLYNGVGNAWRKSGIKREDLFLVTKVWTSNAGEERAAKSIDESLRPTVCEILDWELRIKKPVDDTAYNALKK